MLQDASESDLGQFIQIGDSIPLRPVRKSKKQRKESLKTLDAEEAIERVSYSNPTELELIDESLGQAYRFSYSQLQYIVQELLTSEISYIQIITKGINNYLSICNGDKLPATVHGEKYHIFANIEDIRNFHANVFYPSLLECDNDMELICNRFYDFIRNGDFYLYIVYAINRRRSEQLCDINQSFFLKRQQEMEDSLGIGSFLMQPIQRLPKYQLLLHQLIKDLGKEATVVEGVKEKLKVCQRAEKEIQRLLDRVNNSMVINDIDDCIELRMLYPLVGKFLNQHDFDIVDADQKRRYRGRVFFFETCVVYTEAIERTKQQYRGYYMYTDVGITYEEGKNKFFLYHTKRGNQEIECLSELNENPYWTETLHEVMDSRMTREGSSISGIDGINCSTSQYCNVRNIVLNRQQSNNYSDIWGGSSKCTASTVDHEFQLDLRRTNWYTIVHRPTGLESIEKVIERLINTEKHYIQMLIQYVMTCLMQIPEREKSPQLCSYIRTINRIIGYHQKHLYPALIQCNGNILKVYNVFRMSLKNKEFVEVYRLYAHLACRDLVTFATRTYKKKFKKISFKHLLHYQTFLERLIFRAYHKNRIEFEALVATNNMFAEFHYNFKDNWCLYAINVTTKNHFPEYGFVEDSEFVQIDGIEHRLLLLEGGIICVKTCSKKNKRESFTDIVFWMPWNAIRTIESKFKPVRLKFFSTFAKEDVFKLDFELEHVRERIQGIILGVQILSQ